MSDNFQIINDLGGLFTNLPEDKIPSRNATECHNIDLSSPGLIQTKKGWEIYGNKITAAGEGIRGYKYKKNFGTLKTILLRVRDDGSNTIVEWFNPSNPDSANGEWELFVGGLTADAVMGFTPFNNTNVNQLIFCNGVDNFSTWNGASSTVASVTSNTIVSSAATSIEYEGFSATGSIVVNGTEYAYTGRSGSTFTGVTPDPTTQNPTAGYGIIQKPDTTTYAANPKGNILLTASARVWLSGVLNRESQLYYSEVGDGTNFSAGTNPDDPGIEDFPDGAGPITLIDSRENRKIIIHKEDAILQLQFDYTETGKVPNLSTIALAEDSGATNLKAGAGINKVSYFVSGVEGLKSVARALQVDDLDVEPLTDIIQPSIVDYDFSNAAAVYYPRKRVIYISCKSSTNENHNNKIISVYIRRNASNQFVEDISIDDGYVADWIVDGKNLYSVSSVDQNVYKWFDRNSAGGIGLNHRWTSRAQTHGEPANGKEFQNLYIEGFIGERTKIKVSVLYGLLGTEGIASKTLAWNNSTYVSAEKVSSLGTDVLGTLPLGAASNEIQNSYAFSVPIHFDVRKSTRYKIRIETVYDDDTNDEAYWAILNPGTDVKLKTRETTKQINSNN